MKKYLSAFAGLPLVVGFFALVGSADIIADFLITSIKGGDILTLLCILILPLVILSELCKNTK